MANFKAEPPIEVIENFERLKDNLYEMMGDMTRAGAEEVYKNVVRNIRIAFKDSSSLEKCLKLTRTYRTPSDGAVNTKIGIYGYFINRNGQQVPAPLIANTREYGTKLRDGRGIVPASPFFRTAFKKSQIENAMKREEKKYLPKE